MNPGMVGVFIPVIAMLGVFSLLLARSPLGQALADRLRHGPTPRGGVGRGECRAARKRGTITPGSGGTGGACRFYRTPAREVDEPGPRRCPLKRAIHPWRRRARGFARTSAAADDSV